MYCNVCGHPLNENGFCPICGWALSATEENNLTQNLTVSGYNQQIQQPGFNQQMQQPGFNQQMQQHGFNQQIQQPGFNQQMQQHGFNQQMQQHGFNQQMQQPGFNQQMQQPGFNQQMQQHGFNQQMQNMSLGNGRRKSKVPIIIISIILAIILMSVIVFLICKLNEKPEKKSTTEATEPDLPSTTEAQTPSTEAPVTDTESGTKTIMVYMVGSDLESQHGSASDDIKEMLDASYDSDKIKIIIYTGGCSSWENSTIPENANSTLIIENGNLSLLEKEDKKNMGDPGTLTDFLNYAYTYYPSDEYSLILWNHGGGPFQGYGYDELTGDYLTLEELDTALMASPFSEENKLEWIGFDACLMATIETANTMSGYAKYMISSQESEPGWGWNYAFLNDVDGSDTGIEIGTKIVDYYIDYCEDEFEQISFSYCDVTLSVMDLSQVENVETALNNLFAPANDSLNADTFKDYSRIRSGSKEIASEYTGEYSYDVIDLVDLSQQMATMYPEESKALDQALKKLVIYNGTNAIKTHGVSIYYPYNSKLGLSYYIPMYSGFDFAIEYTSFITNFSVLLTGDSTLTSRWDASTLYPYNNGDYTFSIGLTTEQIADIQNAYFVISREDPGAPGKYSFVSMSDQVSLDAAGTLTANFDGNIIYIQDNTTLEKYEVMYTVEESTDQYTRYLLSAILFNNDIDEEDAMYTYFVLETTPANPEGALIGAYPIANLINSNGQDLFPERYEVNIYDYKYIAFGSYSHEFTSDEDLTNFDETDWSDLVLTYDYFPVSDGFSTIQGSMIDSLSYYGMFIIEDLQGNRHSSNLVQIK